MPARGAFSPLSDPLRLLRELPSAPGGFLAALPLTPRLEDGSRPARRCSGLDSAGWPSVELKVSSVAAAVMGAAVGLFCCLISVSILDFFVVSTVFILNHGWVADWACSAQGTSDRLLHPIHLNQGTSQHLTVCQPVSQLKESPPPADGLDTRTQNQR